MSPRHYSVSNSYSQGISVCIDVTEPYIFLGKLTLAAADGTPGSTSRLIHGNWRSINRRENSVIEVDMKGKNVAYITIIGEDGRIIADHLPLYSDEGIIVSKYGCFKRARDRSRPWIDMEGYNHERPTVIYSIRNALTDNPNDVDNDTRQRGYQWCTTMGGTWANISRDAIEIQHMRGGLTNKLYLCSIPNHIDVSDNEPRTVLLRIYGDIAKTDREFLLKNSVTFSIFSEQKLGPKLYRIHPEGRLEEYIPTRCLSRTELFQLHISRKIARSLARFHSLEMPLCKEPNMLKDTLQYWLEKVGNILLHHPRREDSQNRIIQKLLSYDLVQELPILFNILSTVESPVTFCHNDLQEGNLLFLEEQLTAIDWEYCSYNYRGFDFGNHFCEWCLDYQKEPGHRFGYSYHPEDYPDRERQYTFFREYFIAKGTEEVTIEDLQNLYQEANTFALASHFFWGLWSIVQSEMSDIEFDFMHYAKCRLDAYFKLKRELPDIINGE